ncbi:DUF1330 domain-containing protein [Sneathiella sp. P13V-1]|uniref:DUF1330 domain-containing protein n=1 Tax=Sneathiella sp. P13V-1 TaxID=2697366 RepID=UPI00187B596F|nr:DUF1330 domain-containing protein [Sneathiella sp. P13V-1]MBE7636222.1 DUF1330 domain-containing protein [Sneathiella sp. P13V-1]
MTAFFVASVTVKNPEKMAEYAAAAAKTFTAFGGEPLLKGKRVEDLAGSADHQMVAIVKFPDSNSLKGWYQSDAYQALIPLRDEAADMTLVSHEVPS